MTNSPGGGPAFPVSESPTLPLASPTPGPWVVVGDGLVKAGSRFLGRFWSFGARTPDEAAEAEANARLAAAAPDLLDALKRAVVELEHFAPVHAAAEIEIARAAIAKAEGRT
jgi:hypothetical protein